MADVLRPARGGYLRSFGVPVPNLEDLLPPPPWEGPPIPRALAQPQISIRETRRRLEYIPYSFTGLDYPITGVTAVEALAYRDGEAAGLIRYAFNRRHRLGQIENVLVFRPSSGVGQILVRHAEEDMKANGVTRVVLVSDYEQLGSAEGFWLNLGYIFQPSYPKTWKWMEKRL